MGQGIDMDQAACVVQDALLIAGRQMGNSFIDFLSDGRHTPSFFDWILSKAEV
jgi:hypothetical protein